MNINGFALWVAFCLGLILGNAAHKWQQDVEPTEVQCQAKESK